MYMISFVKTFKFKYILYGLYESLEFYIGFIFTFLLGVVQSLITYYLNIPLNLRTSVVSQAYTHVLNQLPQYGDLDNIRADIIIMNQILIFLILDIVCILIINKSIFDIILWFVKYEDHYRNHKSKMIIYAFIKYFAVLLWLFSWKIDSLYFIVYSILFSLYFPLNIIVRIATKGKQSILFYLLGLKNV